jgi:hypothetical protein
MVWAIHSNVAAASKPDLLNHVETLVTVRLFTVLLFLASAELDVVDPTAMENLCDFINTSVWGSFLVVVIGRLLELRSINIPMKSPWTCSWRLLGLFVEFLRRWRSDSFKGGWFRPCKTMLGWMSSVRMGSGIEPQDSEITKAKDARNTEMIRRYCPAAQRVDMTSPVAPQRLFLDDRGETPSIVPVHSSHKHSKDQ